MLDPDANRLGMSLTGSYPVKVSAIKDLETFSRDIIRLLSQAEIFSFRLSNLCKVRIWTLKSCKRSLSPCLEL